VYGNLSAAEKSIIVKTDSGGTSTVTEAGSRAKAAFGQSIQWMSWFSAGMILGNMENCQIRLITLNILCSNLKLQRMSKGE